MTGLTYRDAKHRQPVRLPDGRTARLVCLPGGDTERRRNGSRARVLLPSGAYLSVPAADLRRADTCPQ